MCGIVGYVGQRAVQDLLLEGLRRLEYRGYDSAGISVIADGEMLLAPSVTHRLLDAFADGSPPQPEGTKRLATLTETEVKVLTLVGGGLSNLARLYRKLPPLLSRWAFSDALSTRIVPPRHGDSSGVRGAAWLWDGAPEAE